MNYTDRRGTKLMKKILLVDACVREESRTRHLAKRVLEMLPGTVTVVKPALEAEPIKNEDFIIGRNKDSLEKSFSDTSYDLARQFADADIIVIAAPYWDLSFPTVLKAYLEKICVVGLTFEYTEEGIPRSLCRAESLIYVTTAGGPILSDEYGYGYVRALARTFFGVRQICQVKAEGLDVVGADVESILQAADIPVSVGHPAGIKDAEGMDEPDNYQMWLACVEKDFIRRMSPYHQITDEEAGLIWEELKKEPRLREGIWSVRKYLPHYYFHIRDTVADIPDDPYLNTTLQDTTMPYHPRFELSLQGIHTLRDLMGYYDVEIMQMDGMGKSRYEELCNWLAGESLELHKCPVGNPVLSVREVREQRKLLRTTIEDGQKKVIVIDSCEPPFSELMKRWVWDAALEMLGKGKIPLWLKPEELDQAVDCFVRQHEKKRRESLEEWLENHLVRLICQKRKENEFQEAEFPEADDTPDQSVQEAEFPNPDGTPDQSVQEAQTQNSEKSTDTQDPQKPLIPEKEPLDLASISAALTRTLSKHNIYTPWDLMKYSMNDCRKLHGMGAVKLAELRNLIDSKGIYQNPAIWSFYESLDTNFSTNYDRIMSSQYILRRIDETDKSRSVDNIHGRHSGLVVENGKLIGFGIHIFNEEIYPLQSFEIYLRNCGLTGHLNLSDCPDLLYVDIYHNSISAIRLSGDHSLRILGIQDNRIRKLDVRDLSACQGIDAGKNDLASLDVSQNHELVELYVNDNHLRAIDLSGCPKLKYLYCHNNQIRELDTTANPLLRHLNAKGNPLKAIRCLAPQCKKLLPLELYAGEGGTVGLHFHPIYNAQWKETGEWQQEYDACPRKGYRFDGWEDENGTIVSQEEVWQDVYGTSRILTARFIKTS